MTIVMFRRNAFYVEYEKPGIGFSTGIYWLVGPDNYRRSYGPDSVQAIAACKRKGGKAV